jgi:hypothetical protein
LKYLPSALSFLFCCFVFAGAAKGPEYRSLRAHGMGGAFVAAADGKDALYYNPAGLNLIHRLGNFEKNPEMGYMPSPHSEVRLFSVTVFLPANEINNVVDGCGAPRIGKIVKEALFFNFGYFGDRNWCPDIYKIIPDNIEDLPDSLYKYSDELEKIFKSMDNGRIEIGTQISFLEIVIPNFGISAWLNASGAPYLDVGVFIPTFYYDPIQIDAVVQTAFAFSPVDKWSVGAGLKVMKRYRQQRFAFIPGMDIGNNINDISIITDDLDSLSKRWSSSIGDVKDANLAIGMDLGVLYQIKREVRLGTSLRNIFFDKLAGESITPNWSIGAMASPMILQSNSLWGRKVNIAMDYVDILDGTITEKFFAHLNFGAEIDQVIIPSPTKELSFLFRALFGVVGGLAGLGIGYFIGDDYGLIGGLVGAGIGSICGAKFGSGGDALHVSLGGGYEGGYPAFNIGFGVLGDAIAMRFGSYAEERGLKTGQKEQRFWTGELSIGF